MGNPARDRLWIISRKAVLEPAAYDALVARAKAQGFPVEKLVRTVHTGRPVMHPRERGPAIIQG